MFGKTCEQSIGLKTLFWKELFQAHLECFFNELY